MLLKGITIFAKDSHSIGKSFSFLNRFAVMVKRFFFIWQV